MHILMRAIGAFIDTGRHVYVFIWHTLRLALDSNTILWFAAQARQCLLTNMSGIVHEVLWKDT